MRSHLNLFAVERPTLSMPPLLSCWPSIKSTFLWIVRNFKVFSSFVFAFCRLLICSLLRWSRRIWFIFDRLVCWIDCLKGSGTAGCREQSLQISRPLKGFRKAFLQSHLWQKLTQLILINRQQSAARRILDFDRLTLYVHVFFSIRSNSPHNGPLGPLCGWVFHIEGRQREPNSRLTVLDIFCIFYANAAPARLEHTQFQFWGDAIPHQRVVGENSLLFCSGRESKLDFCSATNRISHESVPLPGTWVSECYQFYFLPPRKMWNSLCFGKSYLGLVHHQVSDMERRFCISLDGKLTLIKLPWCSCN